MKSLRIVVLFIVLALVPFSASATYTQQFTLGADSTFQGQIQVAMLQAAIAVLGEATSTTGHLQRGAFAAKVIQDPTKWTAIVALVIASQNNNAMTPLTVPSTVADSLIQTAMNAQWSNMSGYFSQ